MSVTQAVQNLAYLLGGASRTPFTWPDSPNERVLGRVFVGPTLPPSFGIRDAVAPFALIRPGAVKWSREHPEALIDEARVTIALLVANANDQAGGAALVGATRQGQGSSIGRGVLDVEAAVIARLAATTNQVNGVALGVRPAAETSPEPVVPQGLEGMCAGRAVETITVKIPAQATFAQIQRIKGVKSGNNAVLTWEALPDTYDLVAITLVRKAGATAPTSPTDGTVVSSTIAPSATGYTDAAGAGTWSYAAFGTFDTTRDPATGMSVVAPDRYSGYVQALVGAAPSFVYLPAICTVVV